MLTKHQTVDAINVDADALISVRQVTTIREDGIELSRSYHRTTLSPGSDLTDQDPRVTAVAEAVWTPDVIQAYQQKLAALQEVQPDGGA